MQASKAGIIFFLLIGIVTGLDLVSDWSAGSNLSHLLTELIVVVIALTGAIFIRAGELRVLRVESEQLKLNAAAYREDAQRWKARASQAIDGVSQAINQQFSEWGLTAAERDVALLLLKGLSHKEIATLRSTTEKTVRVQATAVYEKANLAGRAELSAFFLEDLLAPRTESRNQ